jgi:hypothetical protein
MCETFDGMPCWKRTCLSNDFESPSHVVFVVVVWNIGVFLRQMEFPIRETKKIVVKTQNRHVFVSIF